MHAWVCNEYTYKNIILYMIRFSSHVHEFIHEDIIMFEFSLFNKPKFGLEFVLFTKQININKHFSKSNLSCL